MAAGPSSCVKKKSVQSNHCSFLDCIGKRDNDAKHVDLMLIIRGEEVEVQPSWGRLKDATERGK